MIIDVYTMSDTNMPQLYHCTVGKQGGGGREEGVICYGDNSENLQVDI